MNKEELYKLAKDNNQFKDDYIESGVRFGFNKGFVVGFNKAEELTRKEMIKQLEEVMDELKTKYILPFGFRNEVLELLKRKYDTKE